MIQILALYLDYENAKNILDLYVSFGALEDVEGFWLGFGILIWIWIWPQLFDVPMIQIMALYLDFEGAKSPPVL